MDYKLLNGTNLAYIGDAVYELEIRKYLLNKNITKSKELNKISVNFVSAEAHAYIFSLLENELDEEELGIFHRGKNGAPGGRRKNVQRVDYLVSSGLEAVFGYLYLKGDIERLNYLIKRSIEIVESRI